VAQSDWVVPDQTSWRVGGHPAWLHTLVSPQATAYVIDPTRSGAVAEDILGLEYDARTPALERLSYYRLAADTLG
jgi:transposase